MISYIKSFFSYLFYDNGKSEQEDEDKELFLVDQLIDLQQEENVENVTPLNETPQLPRNAVCFQRTGIITDINEERIQIDYNLFFDRLACNMNLSVKDKVLYLCYKDFDDAIVILRILENCGPYWGDSEDVDEDSFKTIEHVIVGEVDSRQGRSIFMKTIHGTPLTFNLDNVSGTFIPFKGDWLDMTCKVKFDENKPMDVNSDKVVEVLAFKPVRSKVKHAEITHWDGYEGICDKQMYFNKQSVTNNVDPQVGFKALVEAVESNQGACPWRVIRMDITESHTTTVTNNMVDNIELNSLEIEKANNVDVTYPLKFDNISFNGSAKMSLNITNKNNALVVINKWLILSKKIDSQVSISPYLNKPQRLYPSQTFTLTVSCHPKFYGKSKEHLIIMFKGFKVERMIEINIPSNIINSLEGDSYVPKSESEKIDRMKNIRNNTKAHVPGVRLTRPPNFVAVKLGLFPIPDKVWSAVLGNSEQTIHTSDYPKIIANIENRLPCLIQNLNITNYTDYWHTLLYMDEIQATVNMRVYDMPKVFLIKFQEYLAVEIKGLAERRPSLIKGDKAMVHDIWDKNAPLYEGFIHEIKGDLVLIKFHRRFHEEYNGSDVAIEFHLNRSTYRRAHQAINYAISNLGPDVLFPSRITTRSPQISRETLTNIKWFNKKLNANQKAAVTNVLLGECRPMPYCIYGPPGTGKTITVIEIILQILTLIPDSRILVATPANSAANLITERLLQYKTLCSDSIVRLIANYLVDSENIPDTIKPYCATLNIAKENTVKSTHTIKEGINMNVAASYIGRHRVSIGTCYANGTLALMGLPKGHFTHIIVDEAGQAIEPEIMIPMTFTDKDNGQIILAGDPMQLGPIVMSRYCQEFGMDISFLSRMLDSFPYLKDYVAFKNGFNEKLVTQLTDNYRSLEEVLSLPSKMFYDGTLVPKIERNLPWILDIIDTVSELYECSDSTKTGGIFVHGIKGTNMRAADSPSWYNPQEASMIALTVCKLYKKEMTPDDIGIVTPYIAQIKYLRILFDSMGLPQPKIGTVEEFQGQERRLIIISTVRSTESQVIEDQKHFLGFVKNPKRLNVALTRAQVAVLLFCDPHLFLSDPLWRKVIEQAINERKYMGCDLPNAYKTLYNDGFNSNNNSEIIE